MLNYSDHFEHYFSEETNTNIFCQAQKKTIFLKLNLIWKVYRDEHTYAGIYKF
jgi:hypothetical protein